MTEEHIEEIQEFSDNSNSGYRIKTNKQTILIQIFNQQCCCESWGYMTSDDDLASYVGSDLNGISIVDNDLKTTEVDLLKKVEEEIGLSTGFDELQAIFVNVDTSIGKLQFALYNAHNGYYGHSVEIVSDQAKFEGVV